MEFTEEDLKVIDAAAEQMADSWISYKRVQLRDPALALPSVDFVVTASEEPLCAPVVNS